MRFVVLTAAILTNSARSTLSKASPLKGLVLFPHPHRGLAGSANMSDKEELHTAPAPPPHPSASDAPHDAALNPVAETWEKEQLRLRDEIKIVDDVSFDPATFAGLKYIGGVDISFVKGDPNAAAATLVVVEFPSMQVVYEDTREVQMSLPYMPGFLAFREVPHLLTLLQALAETHKEVYPQVVMVDGNGVLHPRGCGLASHLGVLAGLPCIGVAKNFLSVDGISRAHVNERAKQVLHGQGDSFDLVGDSGRVWGTALLGSAGSLNPIYVSVGHRISLGAAVRLVSLCCSAARVPEPIRQADQRSREFLSPTGRELPKPTLAL